MAPFGLEKITTDSHVDAHVTTEYPNVTYPKLKRHI